MPHLRHHQTSALLLTIPDANEAAVVAVAVGLDRVVLDDVGLLFDAAAVVASAEAALEQMEGDERTRLTGRLAELRGPVAASVVALLESDDPDPVAIVAEADAEAPTLALPALPAASTDDPPADG